MYIQKHQHYKRKQDDLCVWFLVERIVVFCTGILYFLYCSKYQNCNCKLYVILSKLYTLLNADLSIVVGTLTSLLIPKPIGSNCIKKHRHYERQQFDCTFYFQERLVVMCTGIVYCLYSLKYQILRYYVETKLNVDSKLS